MRPEVIGIYTGDPLRGGTLVDWIEAKLHYSRYYTFGPGQTTYIRYRGRWLKVRMLKVPGRHAPMYGAQAGDWYTERED